MYKINIAFKTLSKLHITSTEDARLSSDGKPMHGKTAPKASTPLTRTCREPVFVEPMEAGESMMDKVYVPVIPANTARGAIRRICANHLFDKFIDNNEKLDIVSAQLLINLAHTGRINGSGVIDYEKAMKAREGLFSGLWGGGSNLHRSAIITPTFYPICEATLQSQLVPHRYQMYSRGRGYDLTTFITQIRRDSLASIEVPAAEQVIENYEDEIRQHQSAILQDNATRKKSKEDGEEAKKYTLSNLYAHEAVPPGVSFYGCIRLKDYVTPAQIGMVLMSLKQLFNGESIGGNTRYGYGLLELLEDIEVIDTNGEPMDQALIDDFIEEARKAIENTSAKQLIEDFKAIEEAA